MTVMGEYKGYDDPRTDQGPKLSLPGDEMANGNGEGNGQLEQGNQEQVPNSQDTFDPKTWALNYRGQQIIPKDRDHLINLAQQGYSYSQSMAELKKQREELEAMQGKYKGYSELDTAISQHPGLAEKINQIYYDYINGNQQSKDEGEFRDPRYDSLSQELNDLKNWRAKQLDREADEQLNHTIESLKKKFPDQPWDQNDGTGTFQQRLIQYALDNDITNLELAYKDMMWDSIASNTKATALKNAKDQIQKNNLNGIVETGTASAGGGKQLRYDPNDDYGDISRKAIQLLGG